MEERSGDRSPLGYCTDTLVMQKAKSSSEAALLGTITSTLVKAVLDVAAAPVLFQHAVLN